MVAEHSDAGEAGLAAERTFAATGAECAHVRAERNDAMGVLLDLLETPTSPLALVAKALVLNIRFRRKRLFDPSVIHHFAARCTGMQSDGLDLWRNRRGSLWRVVEAGEIGWLQ